MVVFSGFALLFTAWWNKGFIISYTPRDLLENALLIGILFYLIVPFMKIILLPLQFLTFGLISFIIAVLLLAFISSRFGLVEVKEWIFPGIQLMGVRIPKTQVSYIANLILSALSLSSVINLLETFL